MRRRFGLFPSRLDSRRPSYDELAARLSSLEKDVAIVLSRIDGAANMPPHDNKQFQELARVVKRSQRTMLPKGRLWTLWEAVHNVAHLDGGAAEIGTYRGGTAYFMATAFVEATGHQVPLEVIDTFEGHPEAKFSEYDSDAHKDPSLFTDTSYEEVARYLSPLDRVTVHKGEFSTVAPRLPEQTYRLVHVDVDLYEPTLDCLRYFGPRLVPGGVIVVDDYGSPSCPGVARAAKEYFAANPDFGTWSPRTKQLVLVRRTSPVGDGVEHEARDGSEKYSETSA